MHTPRAWLRLDTMVVEKTDYLTGRNVRYLRVDTPDLPSSQLDAGDGGFDGVGSGGMTGGGAGLRDGAACTPPPRENGEGPFGNGGSGGGSTGRRSWSSKRASPPAAAPNGGTKISPERLFGDVSSSASGVVAAGSNGNGVGHR